MARYPCGEEIMRICSEYDIKPYYIAARAGLLGTRIYHYIDGLMHPRAAALERLCAALDNMDIIYDRDKLSYHPARARRERQKEKKETKLVNSKAINRQSLSCTTHAHNTVPATPITACASTSCSRSTQISRGMGS